MANLFVDFDLVVIAFFLPSPFLFRMPFFIVPLLRLQFYLLRYKCYLTLRTSSDYRVLGMIFGPGWVCGGVFLYIYFWRCTSWSSGVYCTRRPWPKIGRSYGVRLPLLITFVRCSLNASLPSFPLTGQFVTSAVIRILSPSALQQ